MHKEQNFPLGKNDRDFFRPPPFLPFSEAPHARLYVYTYNLIRGNT